MNMIRPNRYAGVQSVQHGNVPMKAKSAHADAMARERFLQRAPGKRNGMQEALPMSTTEDLRRLIASILLLGRKS